MANSTRVTASTTVERSVADVFAFLADARNMQQWMTGVGEVDVVDGEAGTVDVEYALDYASYGRSQRIPVRVAAFDPPNRVGFVAVDGPFPFEIEFAVEATAGGSRVRNTIQPGAGGAVTHTLFALFAPVRRRLVRQRLLRDFDVLRAAIDSDSRAHDERDTEANGPSDRGIEAAHPESHAVEGPSPVDREMVGPSPADRATEDPSPADRDTEADVAGANPSSRDASRLSLRDR